MPNSDDRQGRGLGRHVIAFSYGDFSYAVQVGGMTGLVPADSLLRDVRHKLVPDPYVRAEAQASDGRAAARRAQHWLADDPSWQLDGDPLSLETWATRVRHLAHFVAADDDEVLVRECGQRLLGELGWSAERADRAVSGGLGAAHDDQFADPADAVQLMLATAQGPVADHRAYGVGADIAALLFEPTQEGWDMRGWREDR
jgi:hypothetical protein